jgi:hypothetical protein
MCCSLQCPSSKLCEVRDHDASEEEEDEEEEETVVMWPR